MDESPRSSPEFSSADGKGSGFSKSAGKLLQSVLYLCIVAVLIVAAYDGFSLSHEKASTELSLSRLTEVRGLIEPTRRHLAPEYSDASGRLVADPPSDPGSLLDPETIELAHYVDAGSQTQLVDWDGFQNHLAEATGKKVVRREYRNSVDDVAAVKAGTIHVVALHAADTPYIVNNAGFVPVAVLGTEAGALVIVWI